jgi:2-polyprenyl-6-hydroxyphenyl methylase / 3-demethylubiquinone-9 3-methyltransferase
MIKNNNFQYMIENFNLAKSAKLLDILNNIKFDYIKNCNNIKYKKILDLGCGTGFLSKKLCKHGGIVTAVDNSDISIKYAKSNLLLKDLKINYISNSIEEFLKYNIDKFDIIICMEVIEHIYDKNLIYDLLKILNNNKGVIIISSLNKSIIAYIYIILLGESLTKSLLKGTHFYNDFISLKDLYYKFHKYDILVKDIKYINYNFLINHASINICSKINYLIKINVY